MPSGTGLDLFEKEFPNRCFDVGIAEQHAVTFCGGLAAEGFKPFAAIYSTFLQRAYDQVVHDIAIQRLPVRFAIDRAGLVGADGPTHAGAFDVAYLGCLPGFVLMAAADEAELVHMVATQVAIDDRPSALRYPRGEGLGVPMPEEGVPLEIGKGRILREGHKRRAALLRRPARRMSQGRRRTQGARPAGDRRRRAVRQAARHRLAAAAGARARGAGHHRGRLDRRLRRLRAADTGRERRARRRAEGARHGAARRLHRPGFAGRHVRQAPGSTPTASSPRCSRRSARTPPPRRSSGRRALKPLLRRHLAAPSCALPDG